MARRSTSSDKSPEELAQDQIRFNDELRREQGQRDKVNARLLYRDQAQKAGVPKSIIGDPSEIKTWDDSTWNSHVQKLGRYGFHGMDDQGRLLPAPRQSPLTMPARTNAPAQVQRAPLQSMTEGAGQARTAAGLTAAKPVTAAVPAVIPAGPLSEFSTTPGDARAIAQRYGPRDDSVQPVNWTQHINGMQINPGETSVQAKTRYAYDPKTGMYSPKAPALAPAGPVTAPQLATGPQDVLSGIPKKADFSADVNTPTGADVMGQTLDTNLKSPAPALAVAPTPPSAAETAGASTRRVIGNVLSAIPKESMFGSSAVGQLPPDKPIVDIPAVVSGFAKGFVGDTAAGVSNAQAARIQTPTKENPVPVTDTSPTKNIDESPNAIAKFTDVTDWEKKKAAFAGF